MSKIWSDIEIEFRGETYTVRPTLSLINAMERNDGMSLTKLSIRLSNMDLPSSDACTIIAQFINFADPQARITADDVFEETAGVGMDVTLLVKTILEGCFPQQFKVPAHTKKKVRARKS